MEKRFFSLTEARRSGTYVAVFYLGALAGGFGVLGFLVAIELLSRLAR